MEADRTCVNCHPGMPLPRITSQVLVKVHAPLYPPTPSLSVDLVPLALLASGLAPLLCLLVVWRTGRSPAHLFWWAGGGVLLSLSLTLLAWREAIPAVSVPVGNVGMIVSYAFLSSSVRVVQRRSVVPDFWLAAILSVLFLAVYLSGGTFEHRVAASTLATLVFGVRMVPFFFKRARQGHMWATVTLGALLFVDLGALLRGLIALLPIDGDGALYVIAVVVGTFSALGIALTSLWMTLSIFRPQLQAGQDVAPVSATWALDRENGMLVLPDNQKLKLTGSELQILQKLFEGGEEPVSRAVLNLAIGRSEEDLKDRSIDILISRLRRKSGKAGTPLPIVSVRGRGYVFHGEVAA
ncbi:helix-turn-helix domain-containing protein [Devosia sp.]|uniref:helix-turn-helix domain-containing protein n=1 Tax=Devosia sp. TaxID=1871048 RepID=UPI003A8EDCEF